ncbi:hypothetical protein U8527_17100 [Kordia algicida OT-1]|uniref:YpfP-like protein n=1 Tax=Kordia algicida OT-1 TaxID=391587 RepID=A9E2L9_9FLAO|nr:hypothetical protein [Kordia algicida]EDP95405.1 YpfP-like protein [Kordia algicida OT-1]
MNSTKSHTINILTSVIGYGIYFPALIVYEQLKALHYNVNIYIIERYFDEKATSEFELTKTAFQKDVRLVQIASRIPVKYTKKLSDEKTERLFQNWSNNNTTHFLCFSGLWLETLQDYKKQQPNCVIDICRVDSAVSSTWEALLRHKNLITNDVSFFDAKATKINYVLNIPEIKPLPYSERSQNVTIHGGGWDLGDFTSKTEQFTKDFHVNLIVNGLQELSAKNITLFANQPNWNPLYENGFPPFGRMDSTSKLALENYEKHPGILTVLAKSKAIVSKPGGMTLMDSLITETPLLFLKSVGKNENSNQQLWENLQLGISLEAWQQSKDKTALLQEMQSRILAVKTETPCFIQTYTNLVANSSIYATKK